MSEWIEFCTTENVYILIARDSIEAIEQNGDETYIYSRTRSCIWKVCEDYETVKRRVQGEEQKISKQDLGVALYHRFIIVEVNNYVLLDPTLFITPTPALKKIEALSVLGTKAKVIKVELREIKEEDA
jgi:hypothetical protein